MGYEKLTAQPIQRDAAMLRRDDSPDCPYNTLGPGLYPDEIALKLDDGILVAVSVERHWQENGSGIAFHGYARWINEDGSTQTAPNGAHVEASVSFHADPQTIADYSEDALATELALLVLGEPPKLLKDVPEEDGATSKAPIVNISDAARFNASIRHQIRAVQATKSSVINL